jgi:serine protease SohB
LWSDYVLFLLKTLTFLVAAVVLLGVLVRASKVGGEGPNQGKLVIQHLNRAFDDIGLRMRHQMLTKKALKKVLKARKVADKSAEKSDSTAKNAYYLTFKGDIHASQLANLRQEVTAILSIAQPGEEVVIAIESPGGSVTGYGLAASQLVRLTDAGLTLTACVDQVAASGGYMMACVADRILAAPFAIVGSIGVVSQIPNVHRLLKRLDVDVDVLTAGKHKAPLTLLGENTDEGRQKHLLDLGAIHGHFKALVKRHRSGLDIDKVSEGDFWLAEDALKLNLVDEISTSDAYLQRVCAQAEVYKVQWVPHKSLEQRIKGATAALFGAFEGQLRKRWLP